MFCLSWEDHVPTESMICTALTSSTGAAPVGQWLVLLSKRKFVCLSPPVVHTPCRSPQLASGYLAHTRYINTYHNLTYKVMVSIIEVVEWSEQLRSVTSAWHGAVYRSVQIWLCTSGCKSEMFLCVYMISITFCVYKYILLMLLWTMPT